MYTFTIMVHIVNVNIIFLPDFIRNAKLARSRNTFNFFELIKGNSNFELGTAVKRKIYRLQIRI